MSVRKLFLIDGIGALVSAFLLGFVLVQWESSFGMPSSILYLLAAIAMLLAIYSLSCYIKNVKNERYLRIVAIANLLYCFATLVLVYLNWTLLTVLGVWYFLGEAMLVISLASLELITSNIETK